MSKRKASTPLKERETKRQKLIEEIDPKDVAKECGFKLVHSVVTDLQEDTIKKLNNYATYDPLEKNQQAKRAIVTGALQKCKVIRSDGEFPFTIVASENINKDECIAAYMGRLVEQSKYDLQVNQGRISASDQIWAYNVPKTLFSKQWGIPSLIVDASKHCNETRLFNNCRWSNKTANICHRVVWHLESRRPYIIFKTTRPVNQSEELLLDWGDVEFFAKKGNVDSNNNIDNNNNNKKKEKEPEVLLKKKTSKKNDSNNNDNNTSDSNATKEKHINKNKNKKEDPEIRLTKKKSNKEIVRPNMDNNTAINSTTKSKPKPINTTAINTEPVAKTIVKKKAPKNNETGLGVNNHNKATEVLHNNSINNNIVARTKTSKKNINNQNLSTKNVGVAVTTVNKKKKGPISNSNIESTKAKEKSDGIDNNRNINNKEKEKENEAKKSNNKTKEKSVDSNNNNNSSSGVKEKGIDINAYNNRNSNNQGDVADDDEELFVEDITKPVPSINFFGMSGVNTTTTTTINDNTTDFSTFDVVFDLNQEVDVSNEEYNSDNLNDDSSSSVINNKTFVL